MLCSDWYWLTGIFQGREIVKSIKKYEYLLTVFSVRHRLPPEARRCWTMKVVIRYFCFVRTRNNGCREKKDYKFPFVLLSTITCLCKNFAYASKLFIKSFFVAVDGLLKYSV